MRTAFVRRALSGLIEDGSIGPNDSVLAVCAGEAEGPLLRELGFENVVLSGVGPAPESRASFEWSVQDAQELKCDDGAFDFVFVSDGLHHCESPHRALVEMYRVARRGVIVFESRDSALIRLAQRLGLSASYEIEAVVANDCARGGLHDSETPNYVYRWTEREFEKALRSCDPTGPQRMRFFYGLELPHERTALGRGRARGVALRVAAPFVHLLAMVFRKQSNCFGMLALKPRRPDDLWPWLEEEDGELRFRRDYARERFRSGR